MSFADSMAVKVLGIPTALWVIAGGALFYLVIHATQRGGLASAVPSGTIVAGVDDAGPPYPPSQAPGWAQVRQALPMPQAFSGGIFTPQIEYLALRGSGSYGGAN